MKTTAPSPSIRDTTLMVTPGRAMTVPPVIRLRAPKQISRLGGKDRVHARQLDVEGPSPSSGNPASSHGCHTCVACWPANTGDVRGRSGHCLHKPSRLPCSPLVLLYPSRCHRKHWTFDVATRRRSVRFRHMRSCWTSPSRMSRNFASRVERRTRLDRQPVQPLRSQLSAGSGAFVHRLLRTQPCRPSYTNHPCRRRSWFGLSPGSPIPGSLGQRNVGMSVIQGR